MRKQSMVLRFTGLRYDIAVAAHRQASGLYALAPDFRVRSTPGHLGPAP